MLLASQEAVLEVVPDDDATTDNDDDDANARDEELFHDKLTETQNCHDIYEKV